MKLKRLLSVVCLFLMVGFSGQVGAYDKSDLKKLKATRNCVQCNLQSSYKVNKFSFPFT